MQADQKPTIHSLLSLEAVGDLRYNTFKMLLTNGMQVSPCPAPIQPLSGPSLAPPLPQSGRNPTPIQPLSNPRHCRERHRQCPRHAAHQVHPRHAAAAILHLRPVTHHHELRPVALAFFLEQRADAG